MHRRPDGGCLVLEFLAGGTLARRIDAQQPMHEREVLEMAAQMLSALSAMHDPHTGSALVHRDVVGMVDRARQNIHLTSSRKKSRYCMP